MSNEVDWEALEAEFGHLDIDKIVSEETSDNNPMLASVHAELLGALDAVGGATAAETAWLTAVISHGSEEQYLALLDEGFNLARARRERMKAGRENGTLDEDSLGRGVIVLNAIGLRLSLEKLMHDNLGDEAAMLAAAETAAETAMLMAMNVIGFVWRFEDDENGTEAIVAIHDFTDGKDYRWAF